MSRVAHPYASAPKLSANARAVLACARLVWDELTERERFVIRSARKGYRGEYSVDGRSETRSRLVGRGLVIDGARTLTTLGELVRKVGIATRVEVPDVE